MTEPENHSIVIISIDKIFPSPLNPRQERVKDEDLDNFVASMAHETEPHFIQPPIVTSTKDGNYRLLSGEIRLSAAKKAGWKTLECVVRPTSPPLQALNLRIIENLHRTDLSMIDLARSLKIAYYSLQISALKMDNELNTIFEQDLSPAKTVEALETTLKGSSFSPNSPPVSWKDVLDSFGIAMSNDERKRILRVLNVDSQIEGRANDLNLSGAALAALGKMAPEDQVRLVEEMENSENPDQIARRLRRISRVVTSGDYTLDDAISEAKGQVALPASYSGEENGYLGGENPSHSTEEHGEEFAEGEKESGNDNISNQDLASTTLTLLEGTNTVTSTLQILKSILGNKSLNTLPAPWSDYIQEALRLIKESTDQFSS
ncbi:MAG: ParB/RepB/Spo0J family partition protein [Bacteroidales bacterium]